MVSTTLEAKRADTSGAIARDVNTRRIWIPPSAIRTLAVTGTWVLEANTNVVSLATDDVGGAGELLYIPGPSDLSDMIVSGASAVDRGCKIIGLEMIYEVAASALADIDLAVYQTTFDGEGIGTAAAVTVTQALDVASDTGREIDQHRMTATIHARDRFFLDGGRVVHAIFDIDDGTASDMNILGGFWHVNWVHE